MWGICCEEDGSGGKVIEVAIASDEATSHTSLYGDEPMNEPDAHKAAVDENKNKGSRDTEAGEVRAKKAETVGSAKTNVDMAASAKTCEFAVILEREDTSAGWGFKVHYSNDDKFLAIEEPVGAAVEKWQINNPTKRIRFGDQIVSVNGISGGCATLLGAIGKKDDTNIEIMLKRQLQLFVSVAAPLGLILDHTSLEVAHIVDGGGIQMYNDNQLYSNVLICEGDRLIRVNDMTAESADLGLHLRNLKAGAQVSLIFERQGVE